MTPPIRYVPSKNGSKTALKVADIMAKAVGGPYEILMPPNNQKVSLNSSLIGPLRMLDDGTADVALVELKNTKSITGVVDLTFPCLVQREIFMIPKKRKNEDIYHTFRPFSLEAWIAFLIFSFGMSLLLYAFLMKRCQLSHILNNILRSILRQPVKFKIEREKSFMFTWFPAVLFLTCCYLSFLLSFLTFPPQIIVRDIPKLAEEVRNGRYQVSTNDPLVTKKLLDSEVESMKIIGQNMRENPSRMEYMDSFMLRQQPNRAYIIQNRCENLFQDRFFTSNDYFHFYTLSFAVRKGFCCMERLNMGVHRITAAGLLLRLDNLFCSKFMFMVKSNKLYKDDDNMSLTLFDLRGAFMILGIGHSVALCTLLIEIFVKNYKNH